MTMLLECPLNGRRPVSEFLYGGFYRPDRDPELAKDRDWTEHLFLAPEQGDVVLEWWCHRASSYWFIAQRDVASGKFLRTLTATRL